MFRADSIQAARGYVEAFGGDPTPAALVAAEELHRALALVVAYIESVASSKKG